MAGAGKKTFVAGNTLLAADVNTYLMDQAVMRFASASARDTAIPSPSEGMVCYLDDVNWLMVYTGSAWTITGGDKPFFYGITTTQSLANNSDVVAVVPSTTNRGSFVNTSGVITIPTTGIYQINASFLVPSNATGIRKVYVDINGNTSLAGTTVPTVSGTLSHISCGYTAQLTAGNYVAAKIYQTSGSTQTITATLQLAYLGS